MRWNEFSGRWDEMTNLVQSKWSMLDERDLRVIAGQRERLVGIIQHRYGVPRKTIDSELRAFVRQLG
jgi:uncharacterized protein YjbJ (UPF0337 family)